MNAQELEKVAQIYMDLTSQRRKPFVTIQRELCISEEEARSIVRIHKPHFKLIVDGYPPRRYEMNAAFARRIEYSNALEPFAGKKKQYHHSLRNDKNTMYDCDCHMDAMDFLEMVHMRDGDDSYDLVDLDPFASSVPYFPLACKLARKGIIIHIGDLLYLNYKPQDLYRFYPNSRLPFKGDRMKVIRSHFTETAKQLGKRLLFWDDYQYGSVAKLYYKIRT